MRKERRELSSFSCASCFGFHRIEISVDRRSQKGFPPRAWLSHDPAMNLISLVLLALLVLQPARALSESAESITHRAFGGIQPVISPDGNIIALSLQGSICRMPREGGTLTRLSRG